MGCISQNCEPGFLQLRHYSVACNFVLPWFHRISYQEKESILIYRVMQTTAPFISPPAASTADRINPHPLCKAKGPSKPWLSHPLHLCCLQDLAWCVLTFSRLLNVFMAPWPAAAPSWGCLSCCFLLRQIPPVLQRAGWILPPLNLKKKKIKHFFRGSVV